MCRAVIAPPPQSFNLPSASGEEAQVLARENAGIDLLLTDLEMPEMSGEVMALCFRAATPNKRIPFMSGQRPDRSAVQRLAGASNLSLHPPES